MAGKQVQRRRGTTAQHAAFTGAFSEVSVDTDKMVEVVHDGSTVGGFPQASARDIAATNGNVTTAQARADSAYALAANAVNNAATADGKAVNAKLAADGAQFEVDALEFTVANHWTATVTKDSNTGAAAMPKGTNAQRPAAPVEGQFRFNTQLSRWEGYTTVGGWGQVGGDSLPLFFTIWWPTRTNIPAGFIVADGQLLNRATYPDAWAGINNGSVPAVTDAGWISSPQARVSYSIGDGTSTFRMPDYNSKYSGSWAAPFFRGDGNASGGTYGLIQLGALLQHSHVISTDITGVSVQAVSASGTARDNANKLQYAGTDAIGNYPLFAAQTGAVENRPNNVSGCWVVKLFGAVINPGSVDGAQLASDMANLKAVAYQRSNILGPVTQSGGVPTGAVIERGSNANGQYVKFADGTMICWLNESRALTLSTGPYGTGAGYYSTAGWTYPAAFIATPATNLIAVLAPRITQAAPTGGNSASIASWFVIDYAPSAAAGTYALAWTAIGRWF